MLRFGINWPKSKEYYFFIFDKSDSVEIFGTTSPTPPAAIATQNLPPDPRGRSFFPASALELPGCRPYTFIRSENINIARP